MHASTVPVYSSLIIQLVGWQGSLEVRQNLVPEVVLASPAVPEGP